MPTVSVALRSTGAPSTYIVVVRLAGSFTTATCDQVSTMISPDQFVLSPSGAAEASLVVAGMLVNWNSRRFEMPSAVGEAVKSHCDQGTPGICDRLPVRVRNFDQPWAAASQSASSLTNV